MKDTPFDEQPHYMILVDHVQNSFALYEEKATQRIQFKEGNDQEPQKQGGLAKVVPQEKYDALLAKY